MVKNFKKIIAVSLLLLLTLSALASCSDPLTEDGNIDFQKANLSKYIELSASEYEKNTVTLGTEYLVTDKDVDTQLSQHLVSKKEVIKVTDKPIKLGDTAFIYYTGYLDGEVFEGGSNVKKDEQGNITSSPYELVIGSGNFIPGFEEGLINVVPNETSKDAPYDLNVTFPKSYSNNPALAGKPVVFKVWIEYIAEAITDQPIKYGDSAFIYYTGYLDGKAFDGGSNVKKDSDGNITSSPQELSIGSGSFIPGFEEGLIGVVPNETSKDKPYDLHVTFPKDYNSEELAGKAVVFKVWIEHTCNYTIPELTDEYVKENFKYNGTVAQYKAELKKNMQDEMTENAETAALNALISKLIDAAEIKECPQVSVDYWYNEYIKNFESQMEYFNTYGPMYGYNYNFKSLDEFVPQYLELKKGEDWKEKTREMATDMVETELLYNLIVKQQKFTVTDKEFDGRINEMIEQYSSSSKTYTKEDILEEVGEAQINQSILFEKVEKLLMDNCTIEYKD